MFLPRKSETGVKYPDRRPGDFFSYSRTVKRTYKNESRGQNLDRDKRQKVTQATRV